MWYSLDCAPLNLITSWCSNSSQVFRSCANGCLHKKYNTISTPPGEGELAFLYHRDGLHSSAQENNRSSSHIPVSPNHALMNKPINSITWYCLQPTVGHRPPTVWTLSCTSEGPKLRCLQIGQASGIRKKSHTIPATEGHIHSWISCPFSFSLPSSWRTTLAHTRWEKDMGITNITLPKTAGSLIEKLFLY